MKKSMICYFLIYLCNVFVQLFLIDEGLEFTWFFAHCCVNTLYLLYLFKFIFDYKEEIKNKNKVAIKYIILMILNYIFIIVLFFLMAYSLGFQKYADVTIRLY